MGQLGVPTIHRHASEADDVIATLSRFALDEQVEKDVHVSIVSPDKDFLQLLNPRLALMRKWGWSSDYTMDNFRQRFGLVIIA